MTNPKDYQEVIRTTRVYPPELELMYPALGLCGEAGEVAEKVKKLYRDHGGIVTPEIRDALVLELGDVMWYLTTIADTLGIDLDTVMEKNIEKLMKRKQNQTLHGNGDNR
jgi:NTP pyrophosphatase (non-canonical NTP hydrolase)